MHQEAQPATPEERVLEALASDLEPKSVAFIQQVLAPMSQKDCEACLQSLMADGRIVETRLGDYTFPERLGLVVGTVIGHRDGFGFLNSSTEDSDLFLPAKEMRKVFHGDLILAAPSSVDKRGRREAKILRLLKAKQIELVGRYFVEGTQHYVVPEDPRITQDVVIAGQDNGGARQGQVVVITIIDRPTDKLPALGRVKEILGDKMAPGMEVEVAIRNHDIPHEWPGAVNKAVRKLAEEVEEEAKVDRVDLRKLPLVTIDGEDARDFDDAVYCEPKKSGGWRLWVAIADVSYYVKPNAALDQEAYLRGNSVYFPDQVIPMLPEKLSNGLCSLNPSVDRLCMVAEMTISAAGKLSGYKFYEAVMHSHARFTYNKVAAILDGDELLRKRYADRVSDLENLHDLYSALKMSRAGRGGIELETQEMRFIFNAQRKIEQIVPVTRNDAHKMIEECMIQANVAAAKFVEKQKKAILYRVHDKPSDLKLNTFRTFLSELGLNLGGGGEPTPHDYAQLVKDIQERPDMELIQTMLLRSMMQAVYQPDNIGHFGLSLQSYAHFTSPIRRYPDLLLHRVIKWLIGQSEGMPADQKWTANGGMNYQLDEMDVFGEHCSMTERRADDATREVADGLKCEYMQDHVGLIYPGSIAAVTNFGFFVRLDDFHIDGLVHITSLRGDFYQFDPSRQRLTGEKSGKRFQIGDKLQVKVAAVNMNDRKLEFLVVNDDGQVDEFKRPAKFGAKKNREGSDKEKKQRHRDKKNKGMRRRTSAEKKLASAEKPKHSDNKSDKPKPSKGKGAKSISNKRKKKKQRLGKKERLSKQQ